MATGQWVHIAAVKNGSSIKIYENGTETGSGTLSSIYNSGQPVSIGGLNSNSPINFLGGYIDELRISKGIARWTSDFTPPSVPYGDYKTAGTRIKEVDISGSNPAGGTKIEWSATTPTDTTVTVETALSLDGGSTYGTWQEATNGDSIPGITVETDLSNAKLKIRQTLSTTDPGLTPVLHSFFVNIFGEDYAPLGYYISPALPLKLNYGEITFSLVNWDSEGEGVLVEVDISLDGGKTWEGWQECEAFGVIPVLPVGMMLSGSPAVRYRVTLSTEDPSASPVFHQIDLSALAEVLESHNWQPGQIVDIRLPDRGVEGEYLIQRVTITPTWSNPSIWTYRVEYGGRLLGIADFLKALVSAQQKKRIIEPTRNVQKYIYSEDTLELSDEIITTPRTLPFVCGDPDAVCGLVVVSNG